MPDGETVVIVQPGCGLQRLGSLQKDVRFCVVDVRDEVKVRELMKDVQPTRIFHLAAAGMIRGQEPPEDVMMVNVGGAYNVLAGMLATGSVEAAVFVGSWYEYGHALAEHAVRVPRPASVYGVSKLAATLLVQAFASKLSLPAVVLRPFQVYGPTELPHRLIPQIVRSAKSGAPLELNTPQARRDWIYVEDVAAALDVASVSSCWGKVMDIGTGVTTTVADVAAMVFELMGVPWCDVDGVLGGRQARGENSGDASLSGAADVRAAESVLAWHAEHTLLEGLRKTLEWHRQQGCA
jgi:nucleoside-diphosphate-sugar epimerase